MNAFALGLLIKAAIPKDGRFYLQNQQGELLCCILLAERTLTFVDKDGKTLTTVSLEFLK
jgi:hypothetical protein